MTSADFLIRAETLGLSIDTNAFSAFGDLGRVAGFSSDGVYTGIMDECDLTDEREHDENDAEAMLLWAAGQGERPSAGGAS